MDIFSDRANVFRNTADFSAIREETVLDYRGTAESLLPLSEASVVQLKPGPEPTDLAAFSSPTVSVLGLRHHAASIGVIVLNAGWFGFMWWDGTEDCRINGEVAQRTLIYTQGKQDGFHAAGGARQTMGVAVRRAEFIEALAALRGVGPEDVQLERSALQLSPDAATHFRAAVGLLLRTATRSAHDGSASSVTQSLSESIFGLLVDAYLRSPPQLHRDDRPRRPEQIVRQAEERFFSAQGMPVSLADLCSSAGVSQSTLYRAFEAICGQPPLAYLHKRRLTDARRALVRSSADRGAVKRAALAAGLTELGRFSVEYRALFGESPSVTLKKPYSLLIG